MSERGDSHDHEALEHALGRLREDVVFPATPDFAATLWSSTDNVSPSRPARRFLAGRWPLAVLAAVVIAGLVLAIPGTRSTVAGWLEIAGIRIEIGDKPQTAVPVSLGGDLFLGRPVSLAEAQSAVSFEVLAPAGMSLEEPETYLDHRDGTAVISLVYPASASLPPIGETGAGLLLTQFVPVGDAAMYIKRTVEGAFPLFLTVNGSWGAWIEDGALAIPSMPGQPVVERPSGHVLIWDADGVTVRMETMVTLGEALIVAEEIAPAVTPDDGTP